MNTSETSSRIHRTTSNVLAVVGFVALVAIGIWLAVYSTRYVPSVVNRIGVAAVYLGSIFTPADKPSLVVVPTASSTIISFGNASSTTATSTSSVPPTKPTAPVVAGGQTSIVVPISGTTATRVLSGFPDFYSTISAIGYLATTSTDSFVATTTVSAGGRLAIRFSIKNIGTNVTGPWCFTATIPTASAYIYQSQPQQSLAPGDSIEYTLGFDQATRGVDQMISVSANTSNTSNSATCQTVVTESNKDNNSAFAKITVQ